ncbi:somatostatin receptor type 5 [Biomphalaria glabrata]|nr:somatostatin receptor type 5-like; partial [Biomphalaria glabrata]
MISIKTDNILNTTSVAILVENFPENVIDILEKVLSCALIQVSALVGVVCSSVSILVLSEFNYKERSANIMLLSLSAADLIFCLTVPIGHFSCILQHMLDIETFKTVDVNILFVFSTIARLFYSNSIIMGGIIAMERFLVVFFPFRAATVITPFRLKMVSVLVYVLNFALFCPAMFSFRWDWLYDLKEKSLEIVLTPTAFYLQNTDALNFEIGIFHSNVFVHFFLTVTLIFTPALAVKLWVIVSERSKLTNRPDQV